MENCASFEHEWTAVLAEDAPVSPELEAHLRDCQACRRLLEIHRDWEDLLPEEPGPEAFSKMRAGVVQKLSHRMELLERDRGRKRLSGSPGMRWSIAAVLAATLFLGGFLIGHATLFTPQAEVGNLLRQVRHQASANRLFEDSAGSPFSYENVSFSRMSDGRVALGFDVSSHMEVVGRKDDPLVKEVLAQALLNGDSINSRLKAIGIAHEVMDPKIKQALILAMKYDGSLSVRLKAMSLLAAFVEDEKVSNALLAILKEDASVQMRLQALDILAGSSSRREALQNALNQLSRPEDTPLLLKASQEEIH